MRVRVIMRNRATGPAAAAAPQNPHVTAVHSGFAGRPASTPPVARPMNYYEIDKDKKS